LGDCLEILPTLPKVDAVITDPPYGMAWDHAGLAKSMTAKHGTRGRMLQEFAPIRGDDAPFDPSPWLAVAGHCVFWGANHFGQRLPVGVTLVWIKRNPAGYGTFFSDAEIAWESSGGHGVFCYLQPWTGTEFVNRGIAKYHPNEKPVGLLRWVIERAKDRTTILDPFMGSGTTGVACAELGRKFIGIEVEREYFDIACERIDNAYRQQRMFA
jgi:site-specific DNA-methyltransferase (adenine-specific)/modification methylase